MQKIVQLKTHLAEAARLAKSKTPGHIRLAVILLDNFVEIQLTDLMKRKFAWDVYTKKYFLEKQKNILSHHDALLKACTNEQIISTSDQKLVAFCHSIRNNLYHRGSEEEILAKVALSVLHMLICTFQPEWKSAAGGVTYTSKSFDPYKRKGTHLFSANEKEEWIYFLDRYFNIIDRREKKPVSLLSGYLVGKVKETMGFIKYIKDEYPLYFPRAKDWKMNDYLMNYSFFIKHETEIENLNTITDRKERRTKFEEVQRNYERKWQIKNANRLKDLLLAAKKIASTPLEKALEKYLTMHDEVMLFYQSFRQAALDLDQAVDQEIDRRRGK